MAANALEEIWLNWDAVYKDNAKLDKIIASTSAEKVKLWGLNVYLNRKKVVHDKMILNSNLKEIQNVFNDKKCENINIALQSWSMFMLALSKEKLLTHKKIELCQIPFVAGIKKCITHIIAAWVRLCVVIPDLEDYWDKVVVSFLKNVLNYSPKHVPFCLTAILRGNTYRESDDESLSQVFNPSTEHSSVLGRFPSLNQEFLESKFPQLSKIFFDSLSDVSEIKPEDINSIVNPKSISRSYFDAYHAMALFLSSRASKLIHPSPNIIEMIYNLFLSISSGHGGITDMVLRTSFYKVFLLAMDSSILASQKFRLSAKNKEKINLFNDAKLANITITPVVCIFALLLEKSDLMFSRFSTESKNLFDACISSAKSNLFALDNYRALAQVLHSNTMNDSSSNNALNGLMIWNIIAIRVTNYLDEKSLSDSFSSHDNIIEITKFPIMHVNQASVGIPNNQPPYLKSLVEGWTKLISSIKQRSIMPSKWEGQVIIFIENLRLHLSWFSLSCFAYLIKIHLMSSLLIEEDVLNPFVVSKPNVNIRSSTFEYFKHLNNFVFQQDLSLLNKSNKNETLTDILGFAGTLSTTLTLNETEKSIILKFISYCVFVTPDDSMLQSILKHYNTNDELVEYLKINANLYPTIYDLLTMTGFKESHCQIFNKNSTQQSIRKRSTNGNTPSTKKVKMNGDEGSYSPNHVDLFIMDSPLVKSKTKRVSFGPYEGSNTSTQKSADEKLLDTLRWFNQTNNEIEKSYITSNIEWQQRY
eukprot:NODE_63_length_25098_cov_0.440498.p3 type:complete len:758 gc:universal NODE_63_length_25098_cov_0.440498:9047-6774(-)